MTPTRLRVLALCVLAGAVVGDVLGAAAYSSLPPLPAYAPVSLVLLGVVELGMARVVRDRVLGRARRRIHGPVHDRARPLHPLQVARAAALAKASSPTGSLLLGLYLGLLVELLPMSAAQARSDAVVCAVSAAAATLLVLAALALERACRTPRGSDEDRGLGSRT